ncbi:MAG: Rpn family recombination-promoting nuclease/putative transposase [Clostridiales Family XIII bacterium]|nr:Rpn family recombination-promoting nuclease/putative transposase [Clostridiales Family XIII bacterium]
METEKRCTVSPLNDLAFKKVFSSESNKDILAGLICDFLGFQPKEITITNPYDIKVYAERLRENGGDISVLRQTLRDVGARLETADFTAEVQVGKDSYFDVRSLKYAFDREYLQVGYFELPKESAETENQRYWQDYFLEMPIPDAAPEYIKKAARVIAYSNLGKEERTMIDSAEKARDDIEEWIYTARMDGREEGIVEGREEGREEARLENARSLKAMGVDDAIIAKSLKLTRKEVEEL